MRQVLFMAVLAAGMLLAGCSKDSEDNDMETKQQQTLTKEQIIGVWRNGDYWVSFDGNGRKPVEGEPIQFSTGHIPYYYDGINKAVLRKGENNYTDSGRYTIKGNTIIIYHEWGGDTKYVITDIDDTSVSFIITIPGMEGEEDYTDTMSFNKANDPSVGE